MMRQDSTMKRRSLLILSTLLVAGITPALIPPSSTYDPAPLLATLAASVQKISPCPLTRPGSLILTNVRLAGAAQPTSIRIEAGRITRIGAEAGGELPILDGGGRYVIPGL